MEKEKWPRQTSLPWGDQELLEEAGKVLGPGEVEPVGNLHARAFSVSCFHLDTKCGRSGMPVVVPAPVLTVRCRMMSKSDIPGLRRG